MSDDVAKITMGANLSRALIAEKRLRELEAKLAAVAGLPDKWRERADDMAWRWARAADELEALLKPVKVRI